MSTSKEFSRKIEEHRKKIWGVINKHSTIVKPIHLNVLKTHSDGQLNFKTLSTMPNCIEFCDNAALEVTERIEFIDGRLFLYEYSYQYQKENNFYFRYEKQQNTTKRTEMTDEEWNYYHPICHLHANDKIPRYGTHETNFFEVFHLIRLNFYQSTKA